MQNIPKWWMIHGLRTIPIIYCFRYWKLKYIDIVLKHPPGWKIHLQSMTRWPSAWWHCRPLPALQTCEPCLMMFKLKMTVLREEDLCGWASQVQVFAAKIYISQDVVYPHWQMVRAKEPMFLKCEIIVATFSNIAYMFARSCDHWHRTTF